MSMPILIIVCLIIVIVITALFLTAVNWGYKVEHTIDRITQGEETVEKEAKQ